MESLLDELEQQHPRPSHLQIALAGRWEEAVRVDLHDTSKPVPVIKPDESIAVEVFYNLDDGTQLFDGFRYSPELATAPSPQAFLNIFLKLAPDLAVASPKQAAYMLGERLNNNPDTYVQTPEYAELGVVDYWKSEGSLVIYQVGDLPMTADGLALLLRGHDQLLSSSKNHIAVELAHRLPEYWLGIMVSLQKGDRYVLDIEKLLGLLSRMSK